MVDGLCDRCEKHDDCVIRARLAEVCRNWRIDVGVKVCKAIEEHRKEAETTEKK